MYENFKNKFALSLSSICSTEQLDMILKKLDLVAYDYEITKKETSIVVYEQDLPEIVKIYLVCKKVEGLSDGTLYNYSNTLKIFFQELQKAPEMITSNDIRIYLYQYQKAKSTTNRSLDKIRQMICSFFHWAYCEGYLDKNPALTIKPIKYEAKERKPLTQIELEYIRRSCVTLRDKAIIEFLYSTGCRVSELTGVKKSDIDWNEKSVHLFGKGRKHRTSFLNAKAEVAILDYLNSRDDTNEYLFVSERKPHGQLKKCAVEKIIRQIANRTSECVDKHITPHIFRHTTASNMAENNANIASIQKILGHENINTTMIYTHMSAESIKADHIRTVV